MTSSRLPLLLALVFAAAYTQPVHYYSNQHQYLLHGLADAGYGNLSNDWLAHTTDPTPVFWITKAVSTAMGEAVSDYSIHVLPPVVAVLCGFALFVIALIVQLTRGRYTPWSYWLTVGMVGVFGTMAADVMHVALGVPYAISTTFYAVVLAAVFLLWRRLEHTVSVHGIVTPRRELSQLLSENREASARMADGERRGFDFDDLRRKLDDLRDALAPLSGETDER